MAGGTISLYRLIEGAKPEPAHFRSYKDEGFPKPSQPELARVWDGVSFWKTHEQCAKLKERRKPPRGDHVAEVRLPTDGSIRFEPTLRPGHYTVWAAKELLHAMVLAVWEV